LKLLQDNNANAGFARNPIKKRAFLTGLTPVKHPSGDPGLTPALHSPQSAQILRQWFFPDTSKDFELNYRMMPPRVSFSVQGRGKSLVNYC